MIKTGLGWLISSSSLKQKKPVDRFLKIQVYNDLDTFSGLTPNLCMLKSNFLKEQSTIECYFHENLKNSCKFQFHKETEQKQQNESWIRSDSKLNK